MHCLQCFKSEIFLNNHTENCIMINGAQAIKMSKTDDMVHFKNYHKGQEERGENAVHKFMEKM